MNDTNLAWLKHYYHTESTDELRRKLVFVENVAEQHMLETEIKRREAEANGQASELPRTS
ncbi:hypothetical protein LOZ80_26095 [Paenibacillus sp. HWE-109]|uniref:hypothetical protein n=1 Tax=Paenibacillus sp. HWE-109 TaxID=1306526 RepID=UPI001EDFEF1E|nr:hypothetical protein [Paenibacillus sp. HWE-109]UKS25052.1 hypothetical protein LOZ80_26095 [Paenibacillus sp. HWE-109]